MKEGFSKKLVSIFRKGQRRGSDAPVEISAELVGLLNGTPNKIQLSSGRYCFLEQAFKPTIERHYVVVFPKSQGKPTANEVAEMATISVLKAQQLALLVHGDSQCYSITKNGERTGSTPETEHYHIYLFRDRDHKIDSYLRVLLSEEAKAA